MFDPIIDKKANYNNEESGIEYLGGECQFYMRLVWCEFDFSSAFVLSSLSDVSLIKAASIKEVDDTRSGSVDN